MPLKRSPFTARLSPQAEEDLSEIMEWSEEQFGHDAASRYAELIIQALRDIEEDPSQPGVRKREELPADVYVFQPQSVVIASRERRSNLLDTSFSFVC